MWPSLFAYTLVSIFQCSVSAEMSVIDHRNKELTKKKAIVILNLNWILSQSTDHIFVGQPFGFFDV